MASTSTRQLAAIMFTDIVGYTALMGEDEHKAFELLRKNRQIQRPLIEQFGGIWIKELGDGVLASFSTGTDAVCCAVAIQQSCLMETDLKLRIGIHLGDVIFENNDVFGDSVNIASRIQALAPIGGIWISESVCKNVANKKGVETTFVQEINLRHVKESVQVYEVKVESLIEKTINYAVSPIEIAKSSFLTKKAAQLVPPKSIAVLPFVNMSNDPEQDYFSDGMAEEIINSLFHLKDLKVDGRTSAFQFKGKNIDLRKVGEKLGVSTVLEGSVRKQGNRLRITAQLINVADGFHLWSERYDRTLDDIFAIQDEIALTITEQLKVILLEKEKLHINKTPTENNEAYELYLKGRFFWYKRGAYLKKSLDLFQQAAALDPQFALAYAGIADAYCLLAMYYILSPHEAMPKSRQAAQKAIALDPTRVEAYTALAFVITFYDRNWQQGKKQFQLALSINANYAPTYYWYSLYLSWVEGKVEESIQEAKKTVELEPLISASHHYLSVVYLSAGKFEAAWQACRMAIELDANAFLSYRILGISLLMLEKYPEATEALETAVTISARHQWPLFDLCNAYALTGKIEEAHQIFDELVSRSQH